MSVRRTLARLGAPLAAAAVVTMVAAAPASAHVTVTPSDATAGAFTVLTVSVPHGCDGSPTTRVELQIPEQILSVTPTRNAFYDVDTTVAELDEPVTDEEGNEVTERIGSVVYTAKEPLPDGMRDTFELSFQVPDAAGETLTFPAIQTCAEEQTAWVEVPEDGQDAEELEHPAPAFEVLPAEGSGAETTSTSDDSVQEASAEASEESSDTLSWVALGMGALGLAVGGTALARSRRTA
jgi:periplasmic copper chaperone A